MPFDLAQADEIVGRDRQFKCGIEFVPHAVDHVDLTGDVVVLDDATTLPYPYDVLVIATGASLTTGEASSATSRPAVRSYLPSGVS